MRKLLYIDLCARMVREAYEAELKAMRKAGWQINGSRCTDSIGAIMAEKRGLEVRVLIAPRKPRKIGVFEKIWKKVANFFAKHVTFCIFAA